jgi:hypothetical protein
MNAPMFIFSVVKFINLENKEKLKEIYTKFSQAEINIIELDLEFSEEKEVKFIKDSCKQWEEIKKDMLKIISVIKNNWDKKFEENGKSYFG